MKTTVLSLLSISILALAGAADAQSVGTSYTRNFGGSVAGGSFHADAGLARTGGAPGLESAYGLEADANVNANVSLLSRNLEAFRFQAGAALSGDTGTEGGASASLSGLVRVGGYTVYSAQAEEQLSATRSFGPYNLFPSNLRMTWWLGPVPVSVSANAGSGASMSVELDADPVEHAVRLTGTPRAWQYGWASAGVNLWVFTGGITANLTLANANLSMPLVADLEDGFSGQLSLSMNPIAILLRLYARVNLWYWQQSWYLTVYSWSASSLGTTLQLF